MQQFSIRRRLAALGFALACTMAGAAHAAVDVNTADEATLTTLRGVGPAMAKRILEARGKGGPFKDAKDLADRVSGIGPKSVANLQEAGMTFGSNVATGKVATGKVATAPAGAPKARSVR